MTKDNFSQQAAEYANYRPAYPPDMIDFLINNTQEHLQALDCATGNGQVAEKLADHFKKVSATDISAKQLENATFKKNIHYSLQPAEQTNFSDSEFDLITVGQAAHWFDLAKFYNEANRILKPGGLLALFGYGLLNTDPAVMQVINHFYLQTLDGYWDPERKYVDEAYQSFDFPFQKIQNNGFCSVYDWTADQVIGFLSTWSAVQHYKNRTGEDPILLLQQPLRIAWGSEVTKRISFPVFMIAGKKS